MNDKNNVGEQRVNYEAGVFAPGYDLAKIERGLKNGFWWHYQGYASSVQPQHVKSMTCKEEKGFILLEIDYLPDAKEQHLPQKSAYKIVRVWEWDEPLPIEDTIFDVDCVNVMVFQWMNISLAWSDPMEVTIKFSEKEKQVMDELCAEKDLSPGNLLRQALRIYQQYDIAIRNGWIKGDVFRDPSIPPMMPFHSPGE